MKKFCAYAEEMKEMVKPYADTAGEYVQTSADKLQKRYHKNRRRLEKRMRWIRIKNTVDRLVNLTLIIALVISIVCMAAEVLKNRENQ